ncbi:unnamed protein product [[Candida] boidinii]|uniref:Unnamed protein product n=1 Tax=Candida boidinii TaxID=5477 RepID=A0A9W6SZD7_CANBO|nr:unnamed protein product [[Candida] boidinii]
MFHTPPTKESWSSHDALENSYTTPTTETTKTTVTASNNINNTTATTKISQVSNNLPEHTAAASPSEDTHVDDISSTSTDSNTSNPDDSTSTITKDSTDENANANADANYIKKDDQIQKLKIDDQNSQFLPPTKETNDKTKASPAIKATHSNDNINDNINEQLLTILNQEELLDDKDDALPEELESLLDHFYKYLKEPRFATPPSTLQISELFQKFYLKCYEKNVEYVRNNFTSSQNDDNNSNNNSNNLIALLTPQEIEEERKLNHLKQSLIYKYNLMIEKKSCDKFYNSIVYPQKDIPNDQFEQLIDAQFNEKLYYLNRLLINFNTLDIDINCEEEFFVVKLEEKILPQFELMLVERSPTLKLKILDRIHELYSDLVDEVTTSPKSTTSKPVYLLDASKSSSSATTTSSSTATTASTVTQEKHHKKALNTDVYLPLLIYTIIKLPDLQTHSLILQLEFIKRFRNNLLYDTDLLTDDKYSEEKGRLLYILTNFEASLMYLCSVTLTNLSLELNPMIIRDIYPTIKKDPELIMSLLNTPIEIESIKESEYDPFTTIHNKRYNQSLKNNSNNRYSSKPNSSFLSIGLPNVSSSDFNLYNADQGLKSISSTVDLGLRSIFGKAADWISTHEQQQQLQQQQQQQLQEQQQQQQQLQQELGQDQEQYEEQQQSYNENDLNDTLKQLSENFAFQQQQEEQQSIEWKRQHQFIW